MAETIHERDQLLTHGKQAIAESLNFLGQLQLDLLGPDQRGVLWQQTAGGNGPYPPVANYLNVILQTGYFNKVQRWLARYLYKTNPYAISAIDGLTDLVIGPGYTITAESDAVQRRIDEWIEENNWIERVHEGYQKYLIDGEVFFRCFGTKVSFVDPDLVYADVDGATQGIVTDPKDYETVTGYYVHKAASWNNVSGQPTLVPTSQMQHRKQAFSYEPRGFSTLLSVYHVILKATQLLDNLATTLDAQARIAVIRSHDATKDAVKDFRGSLDNLGHQPCSPTGTGATETVEKYDAGSIVDVGKATSVTFPSEGLQADKYVAVLRAMLRQVACRCGLPEALLSADMDSIAAYAGQLVPNSHLMRSTKRKQQQWSNADLQLLKMCGIPTKDVHIQFTSPVIVDKKQEAEIIKLLLDKGALSKHTAAATFDFDYDSEQEQIEKEQAELPEPQLAPDAPNANTRLDADQSVADDKSVEGTNQ